MVLYIKGEKDMNAGTIALIISLTFVVILVIGFFSGFWRGLKKSTINIILSIVGAIIAFFITPLITKAVMGIKIEYNGEMTTIGNMLVVLINNNPDIASIVARNPNMEVFFANLPQALANTVMFVAVSAAMEFVVYLIYKLVAMIFVRNKSVEYQPIVIDDNDDDKNTTTIQKEVKRKPKKHRVWGGVVGLAKTFLLTVFAFMPMASLIGLADKLTTAEDYTTSTEVVALAEEPVAPPAEGGQTPTEPAKKGHLLDKYIPEQAVQAIKGSEKSLLVKICGVFGMDDAMFDYLTAFSIDKEYVYVRQEVENIYAVADLGYQISQTKDLKFADIDYDKVDNAIQQVLDGGLYKTVLCDFMADMLQNYNEYSFLKGNAFITENKAIFDAISKDLQEYITDGNTDSFFRNDIKQVLKIAKNLGGNGIIDEIMDMPARTPEKIIAAIASETNIEHFSQAMTDLFQLKILRAGVVPIVQTALDKVMTGLDQIKADVTAWTDEHWADLSKSLTTVVKDVSTIIEKVDIMQVVSDPTILIQKGSEYDISTILSTLGKVVDEIASIDLLKTENGTPIINKLLVDNGIKLPTETVYDATGKAVSIANYQGLFEFIAPSMLRIKDTGLYDIMNAGGDANLIMANLTNLIAQEGNNNLLSEILLPLQQVEPTKTIITKLTNSVSNDIVDFKLLTTYDEWKTDLSHISNLLITLNGMKVGQDTYLTLALNGNMDVVLKNITPTDIEKMMQPILYAKTTQAFKQTLMNNVATVLNTITGATNTIDISKVTLLKGAKEDQATEIIDILKSFVAINSGYVDGAEFKNLDKILIGNLMTSLQKNAYRVELSQANTELLTEEGLFKNAFVNMMTTFTTAYSAEIDLLKLQPDFEHYFDEANYQNIDFTLIFTKISELDSMGK